MVKVSFDNFIIQQGVVQASRFSAAFGDKTQTLISDDPNHPDNPDAPVPAYQAPADFFQWAQGYYDADNNGVTSYHGLARTDDLTEPASLSHHFILRNYPAFDPTKVLQATVRFDVHYDESRDQYQNDELLFWDSTQPTAKPYRFFYGGRLHDVLHSVNDPARWSPQWKSVILDLTTGDAYAYDVNSDGSLGTSYGKMGTWGDGNSHTTYPDTGTPAGVLQLASSGTLFGVVSDDLVLSYVALEGSTAQRTVSGSVTLDGVVNPAQTVSLTFRPTNGGPNFVRTVTLNADKTFALTGIPGNAYTVHIKGDRWLAQNVSVDATNDGQSGVTAILAAGDANNDNSVNVGDFGLLVNAFGSAINDGSNYDVRADLNADGSIDVADFALLVNNYGAAGDL